MSDTTSDGTDEPDRQPIDREAATARDASAGRTTSTDREAATARDHHELVHSEPTDVRFRSGEETCAATLYRPQDAAGETPCVVMSHGFSLTRRDGLDRFADRFAAAGIATLSFDFRHLGDSDGEPRQLIDADRQQADLVAAIDAARRRSEIDADRIALWGFSFGGGHVLSVAASEDRLAAAVAMAPFLDGLAAARAYALRDNVRYVSEAVRAGLARRPMRMAVTGPPGAPAILTQPEAEPGFERVRGPDSRWRNEFLARPSQPIVGYRPVRDADSVECPLLVCFATEDTIAPPEAIERAADRAPAGTLRRYPIGHFDAFFEGFDAVAGDQVAFLEETVG